MIDAMTKPNRALGTVLVAGLLCLGGVGQASAQEERCNFEVKGQCTKVSKAARTACRKDSGEEYWLSVGRCKYMNGDRAQCLLDARVERSDVRDECEAVCIARQGLCDQLGQDPYDPVIDPANFIDPSQIAASPNPYYPLIAGTEWVYEGDGEIIVVTVLAETVDILGVTCVAVRDVVSEDGEPIEDTVDWYAQDTAGNVWYFGEISQNFENGELVDLDGSWKSGVEGAKPGIVMFAAPQVGDVYRQEFALGNAEDYAEVLALDGNETSPGADCNNACVVTFDGTPLEPDAAEHKYYASGIGFIAEVKPGTGERVELVSMTMP